MALPWEKYAPAPAQAPTTESGPWANYAVASPAPTPTATPIPSGVSVPTGDWRTQAVESELPGGRKSRITSPSDAATFADGVPGAVGKSVRAVGEGVMSLPSLLANMISVPLGAGADLIAGPGTTDAIRNSPAGGFGFFGDNGNAGTTMADMAGLPKPENNFEEQVSSVARGTSGAVTSLGAGGALAGASNPVVAGVGETLAAQPAAQIVSGGTGALAGELTKEGGGGPKSQIAASLLAGLLPFAPGTMADGLKSLVRGGDKGAAAMQDNIAAFTSAGDSPTVGQATGAGNLQKLESILSNAPGSGGVMQAKAQTQQANIGDRVDELANTLSPTSGEAAQVGRAIKSGVEDSFVPDARAVQSGLYSKLDAYIPAGTPADISSTSGILQKLASPIPGAKELSNSSLLSNPTIKEVFDAVKKDGASGSLPYEALKELRTRIGYKLSDFQLASDVPRAQLKQLYGALSSDMETAAKTAGPEAYKAFQRANNYTRAMNDRLDLLQSVVDRSGGPEKIFTAATSGTREGATTLRAVMQSLPKEGQQMLASSIIRRLGRSVASKETQNTDFSTETFLTNWNKLSPAAKQATFNRFGSDFAKDMDDIAKVASNLREGTKLFANPSGTAQALGNKSTAFFFVMSALTGNMKTAGGIAGTVLTANLAARAMTNPTVVRWLAQQAKSPKGTIPAAIQNLSAQALRHKDPEARDIAIALKEQLANPAQPATTQPAP